MRSRRPPPDEGLKEPVRPFSETFRAETVILEWFFKGQSCGKSTVDPKASA